jgi:rare lipoprotein A
MKFLFVLIFILLNSCSSVKIPSDNKGAYYQDDGPHEVIDVRLENIKNAIPIDEPINKNTKKPYKVFDQKYIPMTKIVPFKEKGYASWYGKKYHGNKTSTGEIYDMYAMTGAHKILPLPSYVKVTNLKNKKWVIIRLNDRGPFLKDRIIDLSYAAAHKLDIIEKGSELVEVELINPKEYEETVVNNQNYDENYLQVGAFKDFINSQTLLDKINNLKMLDNYEAKNIQINNLFHILIGPIKNSGELNKIKENLESEYNLTVYVKKYH